MELWLSAVLVANAIAIGLTLVDKYIVSRASVVGYLLAIGLVGLLSFLLIPLTGAQWPTLNEWSLGLLVGILFSVIIYAAFRAYQKEEVSRLAPLGILPTLLITIFAAIFFDERLKSWQYWAFALFLFGALLLATRIELRLRWHTDLAHFTIERAPRFARAVLTTPAWRAQIGASVRSVFMSAYEAAINPRVTFIQATKRLRPIKGLGWYSLALGLDVPFALLSKQLNQGGTEIVNGFATIRAGLLIGAVLIAIGNKEEIIQFFRHTRIVVIASAKEVFGVASNFLFLFASAAGPIGVVRSMNAIIAVGVLVAGSVLAHYGVIRESLKRRDIIQKSIGVLFVVGATVLLFL